MEKIAICISTRDRPEAFDKCYKEILYNTSPIIDDYENKSFYETKIFVVDDSSEDLYCKSDYRFTKRSGIPRVKNKCLELAMDWGADHIFLFDDDCYPIVPGWHLPYIKSGYHHLCYTFLPELAVKNHIKIHSLGNGCMMCFSRHCIETVGGFDAEFGLGKFEHTELSHRIHNAGLTPYVFMDVVGSEKLFHSMDEHAEVDRTLSPGEQKALMSKNSILFNLKRKDKHFKPYIQ